MRRVLVAAGAMLLAPAAAEAHVAVSPPFVNGGIESKITFEAPNERRSNTLTGFSVRAPAGFSVDSAGAPAGWEVTVAGRTVTWSGAARAGGAAVAFPLQVTAHTQPGTYAFEAVQTYDDHAAVKWDVNLALLPATGAAAPKEHPLGAVAAALVGISVVAASLLGLHRFRRSPLQDR